MWQDTVLFICSLVFGVLLIPQMRFMYKTKLGMNLLSCTTTLAFLVVLSYTYATLSLPLAVLGGVTNAGAWAIITALSVKYRSPSRL